MVEIELNYEGQLRCTAQHQPSGGTISTDAPVDNHGRGESFSPTDLVATALITCMATIMGIAAREREIDLTGLRMKVKKEMSSDLPRRIAALHVEAFVPVAEDSPHCVILEKAAMTCPVHQSIHPDIKVPITWHWEG
ncbi:MAG: OsmC family protein [Akkermansiaceae bacterium]|jgi:uncharacterized OsmC-like protein